MEMKFQIQENEAYYLRQYAALQFPESPENRNIKFPLHLLQQEKYIGHSRISFSEAEKGDDFSYGEAGEKGRLYHSIEDVVKHAIGIHGFSEEKITEENEIRKRNGEKTFVYFDDSGCCDYKDYLRDYNIDPDKVNVYRAEKTQKTMAVAFSQRELMAVQEALPIHIFKQTHITSAPGGSSDHMSGDYLPIMNFLLRIGTQLLHTKMIEDGVSIVTNNIMTINEILQQFEKSPNTKFVAADYTVVDNATCKKMQVVLSGRVQMNYHGTQKNPFGTSEVVITNGTEAKTYLYPFGDDVKLESLRCTNIPLFEGDCLEPVERLYLYTQYDDGIELKLCAVLKNLLLHQ